MRKIRFWAAILAALMIVPLLPVSAARAAGMMNVGLSASEDSVKAGDTISLRVNFGTFPHLTRFGPIEVQFDPAYVSFSGMDRGSGMPSTFAVSNAASTSVISISGVDQTVENQIAANQTAPSTDPSGNPVPPPSDPSMYSESTVTVCTLYFKVIDTAPTGDARFWLGNLGGFKDSSGGQVTATAGDTVKVPVQTILSSEASLASLSLGDVPFTPEFSPSVYNYEAHVSRSVTDVAVTAKASDPAARVTITGGDSLQVGNNEAVVKVQAQDGKTALEYKISIIRDESFLPEGASITDAGGKTYVFAEIPESLVLPDGFSQETRKVEDQSVPVYAAVGVKSLLLYLQDGENPPALYLYNPDTNVIRSFDSSSAIVQPAQLYVISEVTDGVGIPDGFEKTTISVGGQSAAGFVSKDQKTLLVYLMDEKGNSRFYVIDSTHGILYPYNTADRDGNFLVPFIVALILALAELGMMVYIIYNIRKRNRPKEVKRV